MSFVTAGAICFGLMMGWITHRTLRRREGSVALSDIATVLGAVGGAAVTALFKDAEIFGAYSVGLAAGYFGYFLVALILGKNAPEWMGD
jgi:uncharacterized membrane protein YeaQ/YmgE (transglycosylase-associated protein family)